MSITLREAAEAHLQMLEDAHYKCDEHNDLECKAEEYGDGVADHHETIRDLRKLLQEEKTPA